MSYSSEFLKKHAALLTAIGTEYSDTYEVYGSEQEMSLGSFPAIGLFLGSPVISKECLSYVPIEYEFILMCADIYDRDEGSSQIEKQYAMFDLLETVINKFGYHVIENPEPMVSIAFGEGSFITGYSTIIKFNS